MVSEKLDVNSYLWCSIGKVFFPYGFFQHFILDFLQFENYMPCYSFGSAFLLVGGFFLIEG